MDYREAFLELLVMLAFVDLEFDEAEKLQLAKKVTQLYGPEAAEALHRIQKRMEMATDSDYITERTKEAVSVLKNSLPQSEWKNIIKDLMRLALADRKIDSCEAAYLVNVCRMFDVNFDEVLKEIKAELCR